MNGKISPGRGPGGSSWLALASCAIVKMSYRWDCSYL